jgi:hypothetical protein
MIRIPIRLNDESLTALRTLARQEYRDVRQQAAWIIESELAKRGLLHLNQVAPLPSTAIPVEDPKQTEGETHVTD